MSELNNELIKIVVDKGLLALIILGVAFYLNRAIERYKAKNIYYQKISETRLGVYRELSKLITAQTEHIMATVRFSTNTRKLQSTEREDLIREIMELHEKLKISYEATWLATLENSVFLSMPLVTALGNSFDAAMEFDRLLKNPEEIGNPNNLKEVGEGISGCWADVQKILRKEINKSPFD